MASFDDYYARIEVIFLICRYLDAEAVVLSSTNEAMEFWGKMGFDPCAVVAGVKKTRLQLIYLATYG